MISANYDIPTIAYRKNKRPIRVAREETAGKASITVFNIICN